MSSVIILLHLMGGLLEGEPGCLVKLLHSLRELGCAFGDRFRSVCERGSRVSTIVEEEGGVSGGRLLLIVDCELCNR